jgi:hypothetical protein
MARLTDFHRQHLQKITIGSCRRLLEFLRLQRAPSSLTGFSRPPLIPSYLAEAEGLIHPVPEATPTTLTIQA